MTTKTIKFDYPLILILLLVQSCRQVEYPPKLGGSYFIFHNGNNQRVIVDESNANIIEGEVIAWNFDSIFIIAKQKPYRYIMDSIENVNPKITFYKSQRIYKESKLYYYWIIDKREELNSYYNEKNRRRIYTNAGPYTYEEYLEKRKELNVSDTLRLKQPVISDFLLINIFYDLFGSPPNRELE